MQRQPLKKYSGTVVDPFPPLIYKFKYEFDWEMLKDPVYTYIEKTENRSLLEKGNARSTVHDKIEHPLTWPILEDFFQWLHGPLTEVADAFSFDFALRTVNYKNTWLNLHKKSGYTDEHAHQSADLVASCYIKCPPNSGNIEFRDPLEYHRFSSPFVPENNTWREVECTTGDIVIFPGWIKHRTQPNNTDEDRIVLTVNCG
jgi:uncharacterized protein (TIGR02466 family)